jgi:hypothetical protein
MNRYKKKNNYKVFDEIGKSFDRRLEKDIEDEEEVDEN